MHVGKDDEVGKGGTLAFPGADERAQPVSLLTGEARIERIPGAGGMGLPAPYREFRRSLRFLRRSRGC